MATDRRVTFLIGANIENFTKGLNKAQRSFRQFGRKMERAGSTLTRNVTAPILALGGASVKSAIDFESAFAGVRKTVNATETEFDSLRKGILNMSKELPTSANEIAGVAEAAGQLGIRTENILEFSKTMVMLGDTTNMAAQEAATSLARIANVMGLPQDQFDEMGSVIVELGNNFATTEQEITEFAQRIAGAGKVAGLSGSDIFAIGTALSSVGVRAESGGTAVQKALLNINDAVARGSKELQTFAETAGMSAEAFQTLWREDAGEAFTAFVNGLGKSGDNATQILDDVGLGSERTRAAFLSLAGSGDLLNRTMDTGSQAWIDNIALTEEARERYKTFASRIKVLRNRLVALGISIGDALLPFVEKTIEFVGGLIDTFESMSAEAKTNVLKMAALFAASGPLLLAFGKVAGAVTSLSKLVFSKFGLIVAGIALTVTSAQWMVDNWETLMKSMKQQVTSWALASTNSAALVQKALAFFGRAAPGAIGAANSLMDEAIMLSQGLGEDASNDLTSFGEAGVHAFDLTKKSLEKLFDSITEGTSFEDFLATIEGGFNGVASAAERAATATKRLLELQKQVDPTARQSVSSASVGSGSTPSGALQRAEKQTSRMSESLRLALGLVKGQAGEATDGINDLSQAAQFAHEVSQNFTHSFGQGMTNLIVQGDRLLDTLRNIGRLLASSIIQKAISVFLTGGLGGSGFFGSGGGLFGKIFGVSDALITSGGDVVKFHPDDNILAMKDFSGLNPGFSGGGGNLNLSGEFRVRGTDLVLSLERAKRKLE